jgi:hypothetical protein
MIECVNDITFPQSYVTLIVLNEPNFVSKSFDDALLL